MITKVRKHLIFGMKEDLDQFYQRAQQAGYIEFISRAKPSHLPGDLEQFVTALRICKGRHPDTIRPISTSQQACEIVEQVMEQKVFLEQLKEEERVLEMEKERIAPFGRFHWDDIRYIEENSRQYVQFFCGKGDKVDALLRENDRLIQVNAVHGLRYLISIDAKVRSYVGLIEMQLEYSVEHILEQLQVVYQKIKTAEDTLRELASYREALYEQFLHRLNEYHLVQAKQDADMPLHGLFSVEAWIPDSKARGLFDLIDGLAIHIERISIEKKDRIPTCMENKGMGRIGEDLVCFYETPHAKDLDPSSWVLWSFALFFAIIIADAGYGLIFLALAAYLKWKWRTFYGIGKRMFRLFVTLAVCVVAWGTMTGVFFGIELSSSNILQRISPLNYLVEAKASYHFHMQDSVHKEHLREDPNIARARSGREITAISKTVRKEYAESILLELTLVIGIVHISCAFLRRWRNNWAGIGWVGFLLGAYLFCPNMIHAVTIPNILGWIDPQIGPILGKWIASVGVGSAVILAIVQQGWKGFLEIMNVIQISADVLSYLRLYALALASAIMADTFNHMGIMVGLSVGFLVIFVGHLVNITLGTMAGVIHGLRLNFIEWYRHCFTGGGKPFRPLCILRAKEE